MAPEYDAAWVDAAIARYEEIEARQASYERALGQVEVTVRSPDGQVELVVAASGEVRAVTVAERGRTGSTSELNAAILAAIQSSVKAAEWARQKVHAEQFAGYTLLGRS
ncbi:YbaB/EbfC family nucleoid-associated protein [Longispora albida]|uniref:YbaB/EbfC family nucleoid-associated protein n=1 Tax=Longispora albida TaxID=203523 RepID=UPI0003720CB9|nr:YbaB/EbfC family nucleoid-associated protein [Longispora albida]